MLLKKIRNRLDNRNNGFFTNVLYELRSPYLCHKVQPKIELKIILIDKDNYEQVYNNLNECISSSFKKLLKKDQLGVIAISNGKIAGNCFTAIGRHIEPLRVNELISLGAGEAYIHYCDTRVNYGRKNVYSSLLYEISKKMFEIEKATKIFIDTTPNNYASRKGILKVGFKEFKVIKRFKLLGKIFFQWSEDL